MARKSGTTDRFKRVSPRRRPARSAKKLPIAYRPCARKLEWARRRTQPPKPRPRSCVARRVGAAVRTEHVPHFGQQLLVAERLAHDAVVPDVLERAKIGVAGEEQD